MKQTKKRHRDKPQKKQSQQPLEGTIQITPRGVGFFVHEELKNDLRIEKPFLQTALHGDLVKVVPHYTKDGDVSAQIIEIIKRAKTNHVGTLEKEIDDFFYVHPQDPRLYTDIIIPKENIGKAKIGQKVLVQITKWDNVQELPEGKILNIIGDAGLHETEMNAILLDKGIHAKFSSEIEVEAQSIKSSEKDILEKALSEREDYRNVPTFTIDPDDAKDFDDALSYQTLPDGDIEIGVHIADVSHYVKYGSKIDVSAVERGTSTYLVDRTIPMLPEILSNDLCSLKPEEDRLAFSVLFVFSKESILLGKPFELKKYSVKTTVINSDKRFAYEEAQKILDEKSGAFYQELSGLNILAKKLAKKNKEEGAISFYQEEVKFVLDDEGKPIDVYTKTLGETNELIENFMLLANKTVVEYIHKKVPKEELLFLYRIHDKPDKDRVMELVQLLRGLGYTMRVSDNSVSSDELNKILRSSKDSPEAGIIQIATIRTMAKAIYSIQNIGHFGLSFENYTHFTSPIRRYSDLVVHRLIKIYQEGKRVPKKRWCEYRSLTTELSEKEKTAMEAERGSIKYKQAEYMSTRTGEKFSGKISGVTEYGLFVEESKTKAEGFIRARDLKDDYYIFEKTKRQLRGRKSNKKYRLGDPVEIMVVNSDMEKRTICFKLVG